MNRWTWVSLGVVLAAGAVTAWSWRLLLAYNMAGLPPREIEPNLLASSLLPTGLFAAAALVRRRSARVQLSVATPAVVVGVIQILTIRWRWARG